MSDIHTPVCESGEPCLDAPAPFTGRSQVLIGSRTHMVAVFTGPTQEAREYAADLLVQLADAGPESRNPYLPTHPMWTPEAWRSEKEESARRFRRGECSSGWYGQAGIAIEIEPAEVSR